ncbi:hypothetical protein Z951_09430 [Streptomyces sp. PRh5]|uniref:EamA family transporter n=1 Tax=Streptomyces sp. PRh5 TaxID=1158056 RepID=UPI000449DBFD|nr:EamA family transporter [Streptomyces sp. PRh5]EXU68524.1 hypothetical protein Z951_09430 [Streptomyces sp. PRh5]
MFPRVASPRFLAPAGTVVLWASAFPAIRVGIDGLGVAGLSFLRLVVAALALALVAPFTGVRLPRRRDLPMVALSGATGMTALPETTAPLSLHPLVRPVSRTLFTVSRAGTGDRPDLRHVLELLRDLVPVPDGDAAPRG